MQDGPIPAAPFGPAFAQAGSSVGILRDGTTLLAATNLEQFLSSCLIHLDLLTDLYVFHCRLEVLENPRKYYGIFLPLLFPELK